MGKSKMKDKYEVSDDTLHKAMEEKWNEEFGKIPSQEVLERKYQFSSRHNRRMEALFSGEHKEKKSRKKYRIRPAYAAVILAVIAMLSMTAVLWRRNVPIETDIAWEVQYVPEGFALQDAIDESDGRTLVYQNEAGQTITVLYGPGEQTTPPDMFLAGSRTVVVEGQEYTQIFSLDGEVCNILIWNNAGYHFEISSVSAISMNELMNVAQSIEKN